MTDEGELTEFLSAYITEVEEHLQLASARLLDIETALRGGTSNPRAVRDLFRALHTVKGLSAMVGVEPAVALAHRMETVLRVADDAGGRLSLEAVDTLLRAVRAIEHRVRELAEHKEATAAPRALLDALDGLDAGEAGVSGFPGVRATSKSTPAALDLEPAILSKLAPFELKLLLDGASSGRRAMRADFSPSPAKAERGFSINSVRERVSSIGEIIKVVPVSVPATEDAPGSLSFALLLLTSASDEELASAVGVSPDALRSLLAPSESGIVSTTTSAAPPRLSDDDEPAEPGQGRLNIVRVDVGRLDDVMDHLSSLIVTRSRFARAVAALSAAGVNTRDLTEIVRDNGRQLRELRAAVMRVRMVPVSEVLERFPLLVRGLRRESGKQVALELHPGNAELDKGVAERVFPAVVHLVRNAVDHAIESPQERRAAGKSSEGTVRISCSPHSNTRLEILVRDDGRGIDRALVARRAGHDTTSDAALLDALCIAGFSTRDVATTTSGRGMGMDIVKRIVVDQLGGELTLKTELGVGTTFALRVPLTVSIVDAFTAMCCGQRFVVPVATVEEILEIDTARIRFGPTPSVQGRARTGMMERRGEAIPLVDLGSALGLPPGDSPPRQAMLVRRAGEPIAFALDRVIGQQEAVVRPLVDPLVQAQGVAGATDLGDGRPTLVLDLVALSGSLARREGGRAA